MHADACRAHVHGGGVVVEGRRDADALSWNSKGGRCGTLVPLILPRALAVFVRYRTHCPTRIAHGSLARPVVSAQILLQPATDRGTMFGRQRNRTDTPVDTRQTSSLRHPAI